MADHADFFKGRLRLTAFLRAVEHGLPQRPSRFKRKAQLSRTMPADTSEGTALEAERIAGEPPGPSYDDAIERKETGAQRDKLSQASVEHRSPSPLEMEEVTSTDVNDHSKKITVVFTGASSGPQPPGVTASAHQSATKRPSKPSRKPLHPQKIQNSQKARKGHERRLPVNCLPLLRTTTSNGLPDPFDAHTTFAIPIAEVDPIHDTQHNTAPSTREHVLVAHLSKDRAASKPLQSNCRPKQPGSPPIKTSADNCSTPKEAPVSTKLGQNQLFTLHDGFVGAELTIIPVKKAAQRVRNTPRQLKQKSTQKALQLVTGELPAPLVGSDDQNCHESSEHISGNIAYPAMQHRSSPTAFNISRINEAGPELPKASTQGTASVELGSALVGSRSDGSDLNMAIDGPSGMTEGENGHVESSGNPSDYRISG